MASARRPRASSGRRHKRGDPWTPPAIAIFGRENSVSYPSSWDRLLDAAGGRGTTSSGCWAAACWRGADSGTGWRRGDRQLRLLRTEGGDEVQSWARGLDVQRIRGGKSHPDPERARPARSPSQQIRPAGGDVVVLPRRQTRPDPMGRDGSGDARAVGRGSSYIHPRRGSRHGIDEGTAVTLPRAPPPCHPSAGWARAHLSQAPTSQSRRGGRRQRPQRASQISGQASAPTLRLAAGGLRRMPPPPLPRAAGRCRCRRLAALPTNVGRPERHRRSPREHCRQASRGGAAAGAAATTAAAAALAANTAADATRVRLPKRPSPAGARAGHYTGHRPRDDSASTGGCLRAAFDARPGVGAQGEQPTDGPRAALWGGAVLRGEPAPPALSTPATPVGRPPAHPPVHPTARPRVGRLQTA